jgi:hypothetical protein
MKNMNAGAGPFGEDGGAAHRFDGDHGRARGEMGELIADAGFHQPLLPPLHDRIGLGMQRYAFAGRGHNFEGFERCAGGRRGNLAEGIAHIELEADNAAFDQFRHIGDGVVAQHAIEAEIDMGLAGRDSVFGGQRLPRAGRRDCVGHVEDRSDAAESAAAVPLSQSSLCG